MAIKKVRASALRLYEGYSFKDKDPSIDVMRTLQQDAGLSNSQVASMSGLSSTTLYQWFEGKTLRPQFCTIMAFTRALGADLVIAKDGRHISITKYNPRR